MSYHLYITRRDSPFDESGPAILESDWRALIADIGCLKPIQAVAVGDATLNFPPEWRSHFWTGHPEATDVVGPIFNLTGGNISLKYVDPETARFALELAERLGARLIGENDEVYTRDDFAPPSRPVPNFFQRLLRR